MLVEVPPMIIGLTVEVDEEPDEEPDEVEDVDDVLDLSVLASLAFDAFLKYLSVASAPATRSVSSDSEAELVLGLTVGSADAVAAFADDMNSAAATAAATPVATTGRAMRIRRL